MRRVLAATIVLLGVLAAVFAPRSQSASTYEVDAIFDTAKGIIPGQVAKIAGARVGAIKDVQLTKDYKARIVMDIPRRFTFYSDANCSIQPEGLISENFVQCDPGTPGKSELKRSDGAPTVPVQNTTVPVSITDLFKIFQADVRQRFTVAIAAVGGGLAARGKDINDIIRRADPTLLAVKRLTHQLAQQKDQLNAAVRDTDHVIGALAARKTRVQDFIVQSARVTSQTADHASALSDAIRRLPHLLDTTDVAVGNINRLVTVGRPLLPKLQAATPGITRLVTDIGPFAKAARPALRELGNTSALGQSTIRAAAPVVHLLRSFSKDAIPVGRTLNQLLVSLRDTGGVESLNLFAYYATAASARYDSISHIIPSHPIVSSCSQYATAPVAGCQAWYGGERTARSAKTTTTKTGRHARKRTVPRATPTPAVAAPGATATATATPPSAITPAKDLTQQITDTVNGSLPKSKATLNDLANFLFDK